jgi:hypothetical protein
MTDDRMNLNLFEGNMTEYRLLITQRNKKKKKDRQKKTPEADTQR